MKFATEKITSTREKAAYANSAQAYADGLLRCKGHSNLFRSLGIGEERVTNFAKARLNKASAKLTKQWWAPAHLVRFNLSMVAQNLSHKVRSRAVRCMAEGKPVPDRALDALADYTEKAIERAM